MYESPIEVMFRDIENRIREQEENAITAEVSRQMGVNIDKDELIRALLYDRDQYHRGYEDAKRAYERPTGRWLFDTEHSITIDLFKCSVCGSGGHVHFKYCPKCGARMEAENENVYNV